ncbi:MAG: hypothetical protein C5B55_11925, partial [Blastocatellia bacterium]
MLISAVSSISVCDWQDLHAMQNLIAFAPTPIGRDHRRPELVIQPNSKETLTITPLPSCFLYCG